MVDDAPILDPAAPDFSSRAKDLFLAGRPFQFVVRGEHAADLKPFIANGRLFDEYKMGTNRKLRQIQIVSLLANGSGRPLTFRMNGDEIVATCLGIVE